jgi:large subunit ribosomal protein L25
VECLPTDIPEHIDVDVTEMVINQSIRVRDLVENAKWKPVTEPETMLVHVVTPKVEEAAADAAAAATPEPEVAKKGKDEKKDDKK